MAQHQADEALSDDVEEIRIGLSALPLMSLNMNWSETMACAPRAIRVLGECLLITSHRRAALIELQGDGLQFRLRNLPRR